jgi:hypothetical protein
MWLYGDREGSHLLPTTLLRAATVMYGLTYLR